MARDLSVMGNQIGAPTITRRAYNALTFGIVASRSSSRGASIVSS